MLQLTLVNRHIRQHSGRNHASQRILSLAVLAALLAAALPLRAEVNLLNNAVGIAGPMQVRLAYTDSNGTYQDYNLQQLPSALSKVLPAGLLNLKSSPLLEAQGSPKGYFDQLWSSIRASVCGDAAAQVQSMLSNNGKNAYGVSCRTTSQGILTAEAGSAWEDEYGFTLLGRQLILDYFVPLNTVTFTVHTGCTCKQGDTLCTTLGGQPDPQFTAVFYVHLYLKAMTQNSAVILLPPDQQHIGEILYEALYAGNQSAAIQSASGQFVSAVGSAVSAAASTGPLSATTVAGLVLAIGKFLDTLGGIIVDLVCNDHLQDEVSSALSNYGLDLWPSYSLNSAAATVGQDFSALFQGLYQATHLGFHQFGITGGDDGSLILRITYPAPLAPTLVDDRTKNPYKQGIAPRMIAANPPEIPAGRSLTVAGVYFAPNYSTALKVDWNQTVYGAAQSQLWLYRIWQYGIIPIGPIPTNQLSFLFTNLSPSTTYQVAVRQCDQVTCAPWSNTLTTSTDPPSSGQVNLTLDRNPFLCAITGSLCPISIGTATVGTDGTFSAGVTIPADTMVGSHMIHAVGKQSASTPIDVCDPVKGCAASLWLLDPDTGLTAAAGFPVIIGAKYTIEGFSFKAGQTVAITFDSHQGTNIGYATVGKDGTFKGSFTIPSVPVNVFHTMVASSNGQTLATSVSFHVEQPPQ